MTPNEVRQKIGLKPAQDTGADELRNRYVNASPGADPAMGGEAPLDDFGAEDPGPEIAPGQMKVSDL
jgi:hypothetical protein